ncbi:MAG: hypothetical protein B6U95_01635 [Thermofilum sp. ex4484_82]|nr:MAG: hypothetical protein B6U95_01635 [Thermofilum sp. ex4484_82]OYT39598.1 MAG: hypothetical protein B6U96_01640 [Archaeoglobales archaeon ex4484_92]
MKWKTHSIFAMGLTALCFSFILKDIYLILFIPYLIMANFLAIFPDILEQKILGEHKRSYLTHHPVTLIIFIPFLLFPITVVRYIFLVVFLSWSSHILLDAFTVGGVPLTQHFKLRLTKRYYNDPVLNIIFSFFGILMFVSSFFVFFVKYKYLFQVILIHITEKVKFFKNLIISSMYKSP